MKNLLIIAFLGTILACKSQVISSDILVSNPAELKTAIQNAKPGTTITMKNGIWNNLELKLHGNGSTNKPIVLKAQNPGKVILTGTSYLKISGQYVEAHDLYFKDGYTPDDAVVIFRNSKDSIAFNCRVTGLVIEEYTQPDRHRKDHWVEFYGQHNELDHSSIIGKSNEGPTVKVYLNGNEHVNNYHKIHHNHLGPRPRKGGPKAETMQLGDSETSMTPSFTQVTNNLFVKCNGEVEIISSKSNYNNFSNNIFLESEGSVVTRHGNYATIDGNLFIANNNPYVGGIRIINTGHRVTNNYFYGLIGKEFRSALAVMNGIPKSALNRYNQVTDVVVAHNSWINCEQPIHMSVGANLEQASVLPDSEIRSARPERVIVANNLIYNDMFTSYPIKVYDKIDGVKFKQNLLVSNKTMDADLGYFTLNSISNFASSNALFTPDNFDGKLYEGFGFDKIDTDITGATRSKNRNFVGAVIPPASKNMLQINRSDYGATWYKPLAKDLEKKAITVTNSSELLQAIRELPYGSTINLKPATYLIDIPVTINKMLTIQATENTTNTVITFKNATSGFVFEPDGLLTIDSIAFKGTGSQTLFKTRDKNMSKAYGLELRNSTVDNFKTVLDASKGSFADEIIIDKTTISNCENGLLLNKETDDKGDYNVEFLTINESTFTNISNQVIDFYRGGYDESTIGGVFTCTGNTFTNSGKKDQDGILINNRGIVQVTFSNNTFRNNDTKVTAVLWGAKGQEPVNNTVVNSGEIKVVENIELKIVY